MNGRVYDPALGRFLSVDPIFLAPANGQSLNPYSYVLNNPLSMTDPSGYVPENCINGNSCPNNSASGLKAGDTATVTIKTDAPTGSHIAGNATVAGTVQADGSIKVTMGSGNNGQQNQSQGAGSTLATSQGQGAGTSASTAVTAATKNADAGLKTEPTGTSVTGSGGDSGSPDGGQAPNTLVLTPEQRQKALQLAANPYDPKSPTEAFQLIRNSDGSETARSSDGCTESSCPAFSNAVEVHWHVDVSNPQNPLTPAEANLTREFPGPGDHQLLPYNTINVGVTPTGAVWAIERVNGATTLDYLKHGSNPGLDNFIQRTWKPGMSDEQLGDLVRRYDH